MAGVQTPAVLLPCDEKKCEGAMSFDADFPHEESTDIKD